MQMNKPLRPIHSFVHRMSQYPRSMDGKWQIIHQPLSVNMLDKYRHHHRTAFLDDASPVAPHWSNRSGHSMWSHQPRCNRVEHTDREWLSIRLNEYFRSKIWAGSSILGNCDCHWCYSGNLLRRWHRWSALVRWLEILWCAPTMAPSSQYSLRNVHRERLEHHLLQFSLQPSELLLILACVEQTVLYEKKKREDKQTNLWVTMK